MVTHAGRSVQGFAGGIVSLAHRIHEGLPLESNHDEIRPFRDIHTPDETGDAFQFPVILAAFRHSKEAPPVADFYKHLQ